MKLSDKIFRLIQKTYSSVALIPKKERPLFKKIVKLIEEHETIDCRDATDHSMKQIRFHRWRQTPNHQEMANQIRRGINKMTGKKGKKPHWLSREEVEEMHLIKQIQKGGVIWKTIKGEKMYYFNDETWADLYGPFETLKKAKKAAIEYADTLTWGAK